MLQGGFPFFFFFFLSCPASQASALAKDWGHGARRLFFGSCASGGLGKSWCRQESWRENDLPVLFDCLLIGLGDPRVRLFGAGHGAKREKATVVGRRDRRACVMIIWRNILMMSSGFEVCWSFFPALLDVGSSWDRMLSIYTSCLVVGGGHPWDELGVACLGPAVCVICRLCLFGTEHIR
ncbi:hypothetical protein VTK56DRAFT_9307 [Thermocarpiscus australiensis]